jgi:hypothetical protein
MRETHPFSGCWRVRWRPARPEHSAGGADTSVPPSATQTFRPSSIFPRSVPELLPAAFGPASSAPRSAGKCLTKQGRLCLRPFVVMALRVGVGREKEDAVALLCVISAVRPHHQPGLGRGRWWSVPARPPKSRGIRSHCYCSGRPPARARRLSRPCAAATPVSCPLRPSRADTNP